MVGWKPYLILKFSIALIYLWSKSYWGRFVDIVNRDHFVLTFPPFFCTSIITIPTLASKQNIQRIAVLFTSYKVLKMFLFLISPSNSRDTLVVVDFIKHTIFSSTQFAFFIESEKFTLFTRHGKLDERQELRCSGKNHEF